MGHHVVIADDSVRRSIVAELLHAGAAADGALRSTPSRELIVVEVAEPRRHGMHAVPAGGKA